MGPPGLGQEACANKPYSAREPHGLTYSSDIEFSERGLGRHSQIPHVESEGCSGFSNWAALKLAGSSPHGGAVLKALLKKGPLGQGTIENTLP